MAKVKGPHLYQTRYGWTLKGVASCGHVTLAMFNHEPTSTQEASALREIRTNLCVKCWANQFEVRPFMEKPK